jgi:hypothetical protein
MSPSDLLPHTDISFHRFSGLESSSVSTALLRALDNEILRQKLEEQPLFGLSNERYDAFNSWLLETLGQEKEASLQDQEFVDNLRIIRNSLPSGDSFPVKRKWSRFSSWGKRSVGSEDDSNPEKRWKDMSVWGKRSDGDIDKKWKQISSWGKRSEDDETDGLSADKKWKQMPVWGKRGVVEPLDKRWKQMSVWGKRSGDETIDKRWKNMLVWGKRSGDQDVSKRWKNMAVWGKKSGDLDLIKRWKDMSVWGKRSSDLDLAKRWKNMPSWGKRSDGQLDKKWKQMPVWGKRAASDAGDDGSIEKRWKDMSVWGKRSVEPQEEKRWKQMSVWGKRNSLDNSENMQEDNIDKKWKQMSVWGKRSGVDYSAFTAGDEDSQEDAPEVAKRYWTKPNAGKRRPYNASRNWEMWAKRPNWSQTGFTSWGKRSEDTDMAHFKELLNRKGSTEENSISTPNTEESKVTDKEVKQ